MSEKNGSDLNRRVSSLELAMNEMKDTLLVQALLEAKASQRIKEHANFLENHEQFMSHHQTVIEEMEGKLNALIDIVGQKPTN